MASTMTCIVGGMCTFFSRVAHFIRPSSLRLGRHRNMRIFFWKPRRTIGTLKSICEQCTHLQNLQLDFIPDADQRRIIQRDLKELVMAASHERGKTGIVLASSLLESDLSC